MPRRRFRPERTARMRAPSLDLDCRAQPVGTAPTMSHGWIPVPGGDPWKGIAIGEQCAIRPDQEVLPGHFAGRTRVEGPLRRPLHSSYISVSAMNPVPGAV